MTHPPRTPPTVEEIPGCRPIGLPSLSPTHGRQSETSLDVIPGRNEPFSGVRVVAAACRYGPLILSMPPPARHHTILQAIRLLGGESSVRLGDQGFLLSDGTFARRKPALIIATAAGQLVKNPSAHSSPISPPSLFSEDMW